MKLTRHISSDYLSAANALRPRDARRRIVAYVESYDDIFFWRTVLSPYETDRVYFEIMLPTKHDSRRTLLGRGKRSAIDCLLRQTGRDMIACVDADYDYLMQGATEASRQLLDTPYVFHTFAYSIENLQCYAPGLHNVCVMATLNDRRLFDFEAFLAGYSSAVWPLFCWSVALYRSGRYDVMTITDMDRILSLGKLTADNASHLLSRLSSRCRQKVSSLRHSHPDIASHIAETERSLLGLGISSRTAYMYLHGHHLFDNVVLPLVANVCSHLIREREAEIRRYAVHATQRDNELSCYANSIQDISAMMKKNAMYVLSPEYRRISQQLALAFKTDNNADDTPETTSHELP